MTSLKKPSPLDFKTQYGLALDDTDDAIVVDLFAGGGGASTGLEMGLGRKVDLAINHNPAAISMHTANHPHAMHYQTDVWGVDPLEATAGKLVAWLHASPDCRHHSQAAGGQPRKKEIRDLSWVVPKWSGKLRRRGKGPWVISLENVKQILQWGPLVAKRDKDTGRVVKLDGSIAAPGEQVPRHEQFLVPDTGALTGSSARRWKRRCKFQRHGQPRAEPGHISARCCAARAITSNTGWSGIATMAIQPAASACTWSLSPTVTSQWHRPRPTHPSRARA